MGDGKSTIGELIEKLNLPEKSVVSENLNLLDMTSIPVKEEKVEISWKHNLSGGAKPTILQHGELYEKIEKLAIAAGKAMNINFATIDVINSGIGATIFIELVDDGYNIIKNIYREALKKLFQ